jgi:hypothetical protein
MFFQNEPHPQKLCYVNQVNKGSTWDSKFFLQYSLWMWQKLHWRNRQTMGCKTQGIQVKFRRRSSGEIQIRTTCIWTGSLYSLVRIQDFTDRYEFCIKKIQGSSSPVTFKKSHQLSQYWKFSHQISFDQQEIDKIIPWNHADSQFAPQVVLVALRT